MSRPVLSLALSVCLFGSACSSLPDITVAYYPPTASTKIVVDQKIACSEDGRTLTTSYTMTPTTSYEAAKDDKTGNAGPVRYFSFPRHDSFFGDTDILVKLTDDGRLISLNSTTTGQAEAIVQAALTLGTSVSTAVGGKSAAKLLKVEVGPNAASDVVRICGDKPGAFIANGKDVTLTYVKDYRHDIYPDAKDELMQVERGQSNLVKRFQGTTAAPSPKLTLTKWKPATALAVDDGKTASKLMPSACDPAADDMTVICLRPVEFADVDITVSDQSIGRTRILVPYGHPTLAVPVPRSDLFGALKTTLEVSDAGAIKQIGYAKTNGIATALTALAAIVTFGATR